MRGSYNTTGDVYTGPGAAVPNAFRFTISCRHVFDDPLDQQRPVGFRTDSYITYNGNSLTAGDLDTSVLPWTFDPSTADVVELPPGSGAFFTVFKTELVRPRRAGAVPYRRVLLLG